MAASSSGVGLSSLPSWFSQLRVFVENQKHLAPFIDALFNVNLLPRLTLSEEDLHDSFPSSQKLPALKAAFRERGPHFLSWPSLSTVMNTGYLVLFSTRSSPLVSCRVSFFGVCVSLVDLSVPPFRTPRSVSADHRLTFRGLPAECLWDHSHKASSLPHIRRIPTGCHRACHRSASPVLSEWSPVPPMELSGGVVSNFLPLQISAEIRVINKV